MNTNDLVAQINGYNSHENEIFDHCADLLLSTIRNDLDDIYNGGQWSRMIGVTQLGIALRSVSPDFKTFKIGILDAYPMHFGQKFHDEFPDFPLYGTFVDSGKYINEEICGFQCEDILLLMPLVISLRYKGFKEVYVDAENSQLVLVLDIK